MNLSKGLYYCTKCKRRHRLNSKIGKDHIEYRLVPVEEKPDTKETVKIEQKKVIIEQETVKTEQETKPSSNRLSSFISGYSKSYKAGVEKFGVWWKIFQLSVWVIILTLLSVAAIIFIFYLPRLESIFWRL